MTVNPADPTPAYIQIANHLRSRIGRGELSDGDQLPSQRELIETSGSAPGTVQRALEQLESEGLVIIRPGRGTFVRRPKRHVRNGSTRYLAKARPAQTPPMRAEAAEQDFRQEQEVLGVGITPAPPEVAERLGVLEGEQIIARSFLLTLDGDPVQTAVSYFPDALIDDAVLRAPDKVPGGTHEYLRHAYGFDLTYGTEDLSGRMPSPEEAKVLRLAPGTPVVDLIRTIYASGDIPVEVTIFVCAADRYVFRYRVPMK